MFRYPKDIEIVKIYNYVILNGRLYQINLNKTSSFKNRIRENIPSSEFDSECYNEDNELTYDLFFSDNNSLLYLYIDKVCNISVKFNFNESDFDLELKELKFRTHYLEGLKR